MRLFLAALLVASTPVASLGQRTWEIAGVPALNYDADEGFGYGAIVELYGYGRDGLRPYLWTVQPTVFLTTGGRREFTIFFDSPYLLPGRWRIDAWLGREQLIATPYYGLGNDSPYDAALETEANPFYYRFGRTRTQLLTNLQRPLGNRPVRLLLGGGVSQVGIAPVPRDSGTTIVAEQPELHGREGGWANHVRAGLVWDTRDREVGPTRGAWSEVLIQRVDRLLGSDYGYTRWTLADRRYAPITTRLVFANRLVFQTVNGDPPFYDLSSLQTSFKQQEGLGGSKTIRGLPRNRFVGPALFLWNAELRWRAADFQVVNRPIHVVLSGFVDSGRVWQRGFRFGSYIDDGTGQYDELRLDELLRGLHHGFGGGVRVGVGENFIAALDVGHSKHAAAPIYIGLAYLY